MKKTNLGLPIWQAGDFTNWSATNEGFKNLDLEFEKLKGDIEKVAEEGIDWKSFSHFYKPSQLMLTPTYVDRVSWVNPNPWRGSAVLFGINWGTEIPDLSDALQNNVVNLIVFFGFVIDHITTAVREDGSSLFTITSTAVNPQDFFVLISKLLANGSDPTFYARGRKYNREFTQYPLCIYNYEWNGDHMALIGRFLDNQPHDIDTIWFNGSLLRIEQRIITSTH